MEKQESLKNLRLLDQLCDDVAYDLRTAKDLTSTCTAIIFKDLAKVYAECSALNRFYEKNNKQWFSYSPQLCKQHTHLSSFKHSAALRELSEMGVIEYMRFGKPTIHLIRFMSEGIKINFPYLANDHG